jgi:molybdopterin-guanine dinucleotide biosynthesis protein A
MIEPLLAPQVCVGLFVGGRASRMGGVAKGLLPLPGSSFSVLERLLHEIRRALPASDVCLVGATEAYARLRLPTVADEPSGIGPLGGLIGLLQHADVAGHSAVLALAGDLPFLTGVILGRLVTDSTSSPALVAMQQGVRNPLIARYATRPALAAALRAVALGKHSLQAVLDGLEPDVAALRVSSSEEPLLADWDTPEDVRRGAAN